MPQGSISGPLLFTIFINDLVDNCNNGSDVFFIFLYTDDAKLFRHITCNNDGDVLQEDLLDIQVRMKKWLLKLNIKNVWLFHMAIKLTSLGINFCLHYV